MMTNMTERYVMVVDDDEAIRQLATLIVRHAGYEVRPFASAFEALAELASAADLPALIFLDLRMPGMSGLEAIAKIREDARTKAVPVVCISGEPFDEGRAAAAGFTGYIAKPFKRGALVDALAAFVPAPR